MPHTRTLSSASHQLARHLVCVTSGTRDLLRMVQFSFRSVPATLAQEGAGPPAPSRAPLDRVPSASVVYALFARLVDAILTFAVETAIALLAPNWRKLPSPFTPGMMNEVARAIRSESLVANPTFNAYFYRAAIHILRRYAEPPSLVLEQRVDRARRSLAAGGTAVVGRLDDKAYAAFLARTLIALVAAKPVAEAGKGRRGAIVKLDWEPNTSIFAIACAALLFAEDGEPLQGLDEEQFFAVVGALIAPRLPRLVTLVAAEDARGLAAEFIAMKAIY